jgi:hypothetical protein
MCLSSVIRRCSFISTRSRGKWSLQSILAKYEQMQLSLNFSLLMWCRWPLGSRQSSPNIALNCMLNVSYAVLHSSSTFITFQILLAFVPCRINSGKTFKEIIISLTRSLIPGMVSILRRAEMKWRKDSW